MDYATQIIIYLISVSLIYNFYYLNTIMFKTLIVFGLASLAFSDLQSAQDVMSQCDKNQDGQLQLDELQCVGNASGVPIPQWGFAQLEAKLGKGKSFQKAQIQSGQQTLKSLKLQSLNFQNQQNGNPNKNSSGCTIKFEFTGITKRINRKTSGHLSVKDSLREMMLSNYKQVNRQFNIICKYY